MIYVTIEEFAENWCGYSMNDEGIWGTYINENGKWDWYQLGGRWNGFFQVKPDGEGVVGPGGLRTLPVEAGRADQLLKKDIDIDTMLAETEQQAIETYDLATSIIGNLDGEDWDYIREEKFAGDIDGARAYYNEQEIVKKFNEYVCSEENKTFSMFSNPFDFKISKDVYVTNAKNSVITPHAFIIEGQWVEKGEMGWFGISDDKHSQVDWNDKFMETFNNLPDDTLVSLMDCHI